VLDACAFKAEGTGVGGVRRDWRRPPVTAWAPMWLGGATDRRDLAGGLGPFPAPGRL
jgi:hypothetical protein